LIILVLLPYVAVVFCTGSRQGLAMEAEPTDLEIYVTGILPSQMPVIYEEEALKAQAVIVRTNLLKQSMEFYKKQTPQEAAEAIGGKDLEKMGFSWYSPEELEELWGYEQWKYYQNKICEAVEETAGEVLWLDGKLTDVPYHAVSAGQTREGALLGENYSWLEAVNCPGDVEAVDYLKIRTFLQAEFWSENDLPEELTAVKTLPEIVARDGSGYVTAVRIGETKLAGEEFRSCFGLNSSSFTLEETEDGIRIVTKGLGHGFGMSLYQANLFAADGQNYREILSYFYKNMDCRSFLNP